MFSDKRIAELDSLLFIFLIDMLPGDVGMLDGATVFLSFLVARNVRVTGNVNVFNG